MNISEMAPVVGAGGICCDFWLDHANSLQRELLALMAENARVGAECRSLERRLVMAEVRSIERQINATRTEQSAYALVLMALRAGVQVPGYEGFTERECRRRVVELQEERIRLLQRASWHADRLGLGIRTGVDEASGRVFVRLDVAVDLQELEEG